MILLVMEKIVDDLKAAGVDENAEIFLDEFNKRFELGTVSTGPGKMRFFGINTVKNEDYKIETTDDDKMEAVTEYPHTRKRRKHADEKLNKLEKSVFASVNSSIGWIGTVTDPFCSFYSSYLQQKTNLTNVSHLIDQINIICKLKKIGMRISYPRPTDDNEYDLRILVFSDASRVCENG